MFSSARLIKFIGTHEEYDKVGADPFEMERSMNICPICTEAEYKAALSEVSAYFDNEPEPGTEDGDRFGILLTLIEHYETQQFPVSAPDPVEAIKFRMGQEDLTAKGL